MQQEELDAFIERFLSAWNSHDVDRIMAMMTPDCIFEPSARAWGTRLVGTQDVRAAVVGLFDSTPDIAWEPVRAFIAGDNVVAEVIATGTNPQGEAFRTPACDILTLRDGMIAAKRAYRKL